MSESQKPEDQKPAESARQEPNSQQQSANEALQDSPVDELSQALGEIVILKAQAADLKDQLLRAAADVQNARRRAEEDVSKARKFGIESFAESLLPVIDSLEAGLALKDATTEQLREGKEATLRQLKSALERNKVVAIDPSAGEKFEPSKHQGISMVPSEQESNTIVAVLQKGYQIAERVMRPALVTVAAAK
ncbi:MAG: nucleotide exchange factor GrpE [Cytophagales bacterium]|nr:nucleotide exchange factor GrpE [Cytophagales bacterium]